MKKAISISSLLYQVVILLLSVFMLTACNESLEEETTPEPDVVKTLDLTVTGADVQTPYGNVYLFHSEEVDLDYAIDKGDINIAPIIDVSKAYNPVVRYMKDGQQKTLYPVSAYGTQLDGILDRSSSVRYSQVHFDIDKLATTYGKVGKNSVVLVVILLNDPQTKSWVARTVQLRRDYLIHVSLPDYKNQHYVQPTELNAKWWQVTT